MAPGFAVSPPPYIPPLNLSSPTVKQSLALFFRLSQYQPLSFRFKRTLFVSIPAGFFSQALFLNSGFCMKKKLFMMVDAGGLVKQGKDIMTVKHVNNRVRYANKTIKKNNRSSCKKIRREVVFPRIPEVLQELVVSCREIFKGTGTVPPASDVNKLCKILDKMKPEDVGLSKNMHFFKARGAVEGTPRVTYTTIDHCDEFSLCIFFLPGTAVIPLHNHPEMTVFSKLLLGTMHIKSYDWVDPVGTKDTTASSHLRLARLKTNNVYTAPCDTSVLYPTTGGNIHQFTAITPCAVLDVIGPPYSKKDDRDCSYYKDFPYTAFSNGETARVGEEERDGYGWLEEIEAPEGAEMDRIEYLGPRIIQKTTP